MKMHAPSPCFVLAALVGSYPTLELRTSTSSLRHLRPAVLLCSLMIVLLVVLQMGQGAHAAVSIRDDSGWDVTLEQPAQRIVALHGAFNDLILAMGMDKRLVGRTQAEENNPTLRHLPSVGSYMRPDAEKVVSLNPDVVLQLGGSEAADSLARGLRSMGVPVLVFQLDTFENMFSALQRLGVLMAVEERSAALITMYKKRLRDIRMVLQYEPRITTFFEVRYPNLLAAGVDSIANEIIQHAGGRNTVTSHGKIVRIPEEELLRFNPATYIIQRGPLNPSPEPLDERKGYATLRARIDDRVLTVEEASFAHPGPRALDVVEELARWFYPHVRFKKD